ncbi:MAG TPA: hypothetical protein VLU24_12455 [Mycobacterium sp.]|nr:hypothetical protein [Mycobacterium sp.]
MQAEQVTPTEVPQRLEATPQNIELAKAAKPVEQIPDPAPQSEIDQIKNQLISQNPSLNTPSVAPGNQDVPPVSVVKQFQPDWVQYDQYYRPVILNPFPDPLQIVYQYAGAPRVLVIPPLASLVTEVVEQGAYSFTAMVLNAMGIPTNDVAVGTLLGGGYLPAEGQPAPSPSPVKKYNNVPVQVKYSNATYRPFVVKRIVDVGMDPKVGQNKVLLDGVTPAWGQWTQNENGERQFEVHQTQQFPGLDEPGEGPLPGDYQLQLASSESPAGGFSSRDVLLIGAAAVVATLGLGAIVLPIFLGRRRARH